MGMMTEILNERRVLTNLRLTDHQKAVLTRAKIAQTPRVATDNTSKNTSMVAARNQLAKLGLITFDGTNTEVTPQGEQLMKDEALIDDMGELTQAGTEVAYDDKDQEDPGPDGQEPEQPQAELGSADDELGASGPKDDLSLESTYSFIKTLYQ